MWIIRPYLSQLWHIRQNSSHVKNPTEVLIPIFDDKVTCKMFDRLYQTWKIQWYTAQMWKNRSNSYKLWHTGQKTSLVKNPTEFLTPTFAEISNVKFRLNMSNMRNMIEYFTDVNNLTKFVCHHIFSRIHHMWKIRPNFSHLYFTTCNKFDRICHLWGIRSSTLQLWNYGKIDLIRHTVHLTENITYEKYVPVSHTYNSPKCVTCNTSDQIYLARDKFDRKHPCCKNNSTELFIVVTYLTNKWHVKNPTEFLTPIFHRKCFHSLKNLFTSVQAIEILMCDKLV